MNTPSAIVVRYDEDRVAITGLPRSNSARVYGWMSESSHFYMVQYDSGAPGAGIASIGARIQPPKDGQYRDRPRTWQLLVQQSLQRELERLFPETPLDALHRESVDRIARWGR